MSDGIYTAETGLTAFEAGLQSISNDTSNMNTPGYKGSGVLFADLVGGNGEGGAGAGGDGVMTVGTAMNFSAGQLQSTGNPLDLAISGNGFFTLRDANGNIHYTQDGQFEFNSDGILISSATKEDVMALDSKTGSLVPISINDAQSNPASATTKVSFSGNLLSTATTAQTVGNITVIDKEGGSHTLSMTLTPVTGSSGSWTVSLTDPTTGNTITPVGGSTISFANGVPSATADTVTMTYKLADGSSSQFTLDFSSNVTSNSAGTASTLAFASQDGFTAGTLTGETFNSSGTLVFSYSNNQTTNGPQLALANFSSPDDVESVSSNEFSAKGQGWQVGVAGSGSFGTIQSGEVEGSNVDLSQEFSNLVIMQRGYQACSQVISTASDMLSSLFDMVVK
jgi:flagellar hook protein FlgE